MKAYSSNAPLLDLGDGLSFVFGENQGRYPACNGLLCVGREVRLIDSGVGADVFRQLDRERRIDTLVISHSHPDHIRCCETLADRRILLPRETPPGYDDLDQLGERFTGSAESGAIWVEELAGWLGLQALPETSERYGDGDLIDPEGVRLEAVRVPGHVNDHYGFFDRQTGALFTTDIDFSPFGAWYGNPESDPELFAGSVERIRSLPYNKVFTSHGPPLENGRAEEAFDGFMDSFERHRRAVLDLLDRPRTLDEITAASPLYRGRFPLPRLQAVFEGRMIAKILEVLVKRGRAVEENGRFAAANQEEGI